MKIRVHETNILREQLTKWLKKQPWCETVFKSDANFVLFRTPYKDEIFTLLKSQGMLIRDQSTQAQLSGCLRISIGSERELYLVKETLTTFLPSSINTQNQLTIENNI
jgi:histidinol-phosphate/aromatic aminotransferase/cobyric acid decarboxylase-like protein